MLICLQKIPYVLIFFLCILLSKKRKKKGGTPLHFFTCPLKPETQEGRVSHYWCHCSLDVIQTIHSFNCYSFSMAPLYPSNGLERANPHWRSNQSSSITTVTHIPIIKTPAVWRIKPTLSLYWDWSNKGPFWESLIDLPGNKKSSAKHKACLGVA